VRPLRPPALQSASGRLTANARRSIPDWQSTILPVMYSVPYFAEDRTELQSDILSYALHLITSLVVATFGGRSPMHDHGPLDKIMAHTLYKVAVVRVAACGSVRRRRRQRALLARG
jgi:hypothetical protein